jgi:hypothetical protein
VRSRLIALTAIAGLLLAMPGSALAAGPTSSMPALSPAGAVPLAYASVERITGADELGIARPAGVAWNARTQRLSVFDAARPGRGIEATLAGAPTRAISGSAEAGTLAGANATRVRAALAGPLRGLAVDPTGGHLFTYAPSTRTLWELDAEGKLVAQRNLAGAGLDDVRGIAIAPSADTTDAASRMSAYIADAGRVVDGEASGGGLYEVVLSAPVRNDSVIAAAVSNVTFVNTFNTGAGSANWTPDSPDPSGLAYNAITDRLVAVDGEVEETTGAGFHGANGWFATRTGSTTGTFNTIPSSPSNKEPVGAAYDPARNELYVCKDGSSSVVWVYNATTMAQVRSFNVANAPYNNGDAEGLGFGNGVLYMADALDNDMVKVQAGPNGVIGTGSDDVVTNFDLQQYGQDEPEGLDVDPSTGNIWVVSNKISGGGLVDPMLEVTPDGALVSTVSIDAANPNSAGGLAIAPPSDGTAGFNIYIADRGVDNQEQANENDGRIYEFEPGGTPPPPPPPGQKMTNLGFELDANGDTRPDAWTIDPAFTRSSAVVHGGTFAGRHASTSNTGYNVYQLVNGITAGSTYAFSGWINIPTTTDSFTLEIQMKWRGAGGAISTATIVTRKTSTAGAWVQVNANALAPAGATSVRVTMKLKSLNATIYVDDFSLVG